MGIGASSALRIDESAYGSLEGMGSSLMGGGRKLKKKPVLVLDPDELAAAHAAFHEASAAQLGEDVERAPRPAMILGLAPMDEDDAEEMGQADDIGEDADTGQPPPEDVLALTRRKSAPVVDEYADMPLDEAGFGEAEPEQDDAAAGPIERLGTIEDGLDISKRIFPSLSLVQAGDDDEDGEEEAPVAFPAAFREPVAPPPVDTPAPAEETAPAAFSPPAPEPEAEYEDEQEDAQDEADAPKYSALDAVTKRVQSRPIVPEAPVENKMAEPEEPSIGSIEAAFPIADVPADGSPEPEVSAAEIQEAKAGPQPVRFDELPPGKDYETPEDVYDLDQWLAEDEQESETADAVGVDPAEPEDSWAEPEQSEDDTVAISEDLLEDFAPDADAPEMVDDHEAAETLESESVTYTDDDDDDEGYAFMRDPRSRRSGVDGAQRGQQSALRAKLLREAEEDAAREAEPGESKSLFVGMWNWLRGLFGR